jgi:RecB family endonuclease NucS
LIIQKEFAGFGDTKERLDLLALDKKGKLVVIENKLDDSGRDAV